MRFLGDLSSLGPRTGVLFESRTETWNKKNGKKIEESERGAPKSAGPVAYAASAIWLIRHWVSCKVNKLKMAGLEGEYIHEIHGELLSRVLIDIEVASGRSFNLKPEQEIAVRDLLEGKDV